VVEAPRISRQSAHEGVNFVSATSRSVCEVMAYVGHEDNTLDVTLKLLASNFYTLVSLWLMLPFILLTQDGPKQPISEVRYMYKKKANLRSHEVCKM
jgi:hypothetical protein